MDATTLPPAVPYCRRVGPWKINSIWTHERVDELRDYWARGLSAGQIAARLNITRNSVIGKVQRMRYPTRVQRRPRVERIIPETTLDQFNRDIPLAQRRTIFELEAGMCRFPVGDPQHENYFYCGAPAEGSYCETHYSFCYQPSGENPLRLAVL